MTKERLEEKLAQCELEAEELKNNDFADEIDAEVAEFKLRVQAKYAREKEKNLAQYETRKQLLTELIAEAADEEHISQEEEQDETDATIIVAPLS